MEATTVATKPVKTEEERTDTLDATHRCDTCGAQAYYQPIFGDGTYLLFCNHHWHKNLDALKNVMVTKVDESWKLTQDRLQGSEN